MLEKMLKDFLNAPEAQEKAGKAFRGCFDRPNPLHDEERRKNVEAAMIQNFEAKLYALIAENITETLKREGEVDLQGLRDKCSSISNLQEDVLLDHLKYTEDKGMIGSRLLFGTDFYFALD